jgi:hypothetical protein
LEISREKTEHYVKFYYVDDDKTEQPILFPGQHKNKVMMSHFMKYMEVRIKEIGFKKHLEAECSI